MDMHEAVVLVVALVVTGVLTVVCCKYWLVIETRKQQAMHELADALKDIAAAIRGTKE